MNLSRTDRGPRHRPQSVRSGPIQSKPRRSARSWTGPAHLWGDAQPPIPHPDKLVIPFPSLSYPNRNSLSLPWTNPQDSERSVLRGPERIHRPRWPAQRDSDTATWIVDRHNSNSDWAYATTWYCPRCFSPPSANGQDQSGCLYSVDESTRHSSGMRISRWRYGITPCYVSVRS